MVQFVAKTTGTLCGEFWYVLLDFLQYCLIAFLHLLGEEISDHLTADFRMAIGYLRLLTVLILFHPHKGRVKVGFGIAFPTAEY